MAIADDTMCMHYTLDRLDDIKTQTDLDRFKEEIKYNIRVNEKWRDNNSNYPYMPDGSVVDDPDDFDVYSAIDNVKRNYIERALTRSGNVGEASKLLGIRNYQTLQNWMEKLGMDKC
jgi:hypothetical protein